MSHPLLAPGFRRPSKGCLPSGWKAIQIGDAARVVGGGRLRFTKEEHYRPNGIPAYSAAGQDGFVEVPEFDCAGVVLSSIGANCGRCFLAEGQWTTLANVQAILPKPNELSHKFLFYRVNREDYWTRSGSAQPFIKPSDIGNSWIAVPPFFEQARIAEVLDTLDEAIRGTESVVRKLQDCNDGIISDLVRFGVTDLGEVRAPGLFPTHFVMSPLGSVPSAWRVGPLGDFITLQRGFDITQQEQREGSVPVVSSSGITSYHNKAMVKGPGVVIGRKGKLGGAYYIEVPFWPHDTTLWVKDFHGNSPEFCAHFLRQMRLERFDAATSVPTLNRNFVHPVLVAFPGVDEQERICQVIRATDDRLRRESELLRALKSLKSGLTSDLLTGRIRIPVGASAC